MGSLRQREGRARGFPFVHPTFLSTLQPSAINKAQRPQSPQGLLASAHMTSCHLGRRTRFGDSGAIPQVKNILVLARNLETHHPRPLSFLHVPLRPAAKSRCCREFHVASGSILILYLHCFGPAGPPSPRAQPHTGPWQVSQMQPQPRLFLLHARGPEDVFKHANQMLPPQFCPKIFSGVLL